MWFHANSVTRQSSEQKVSVIEVTVLLLPGGSSDGIQLMMQYYARKTMNISGQKGLCGASRNVCLMSTKYKL
jgi:hypothetical protein